LADGEVVALNETGVECAAILGVKKGLLQFCIGAKKESTLDTNHPILPAFLDDLTVKANPRQQPPRCPLIHLEAIGGE
jgi:hypothetical protein